MNPSARWPISNWDAPTRCRVTLLRAAPRIKIFLPSGKTPILTFPSCAKPRPNTPDSRKLVTFPQNLCPPSACNHLDTNAHPVLTPRLRGGLSHEFSFAHGSQLGRGISLCFSRSHLSSGFFP